MLQEETKIDYSHTDKQTAVFAGGYEVKSRLCSVCLAACSLVPSGEEDFLLLLILSTVLQPRLYSGGGVYIPACRTELGSALFVEGHLGSSVWLTANSSLSYRFLCLYKPSVSLSPPCCVSDLWSVWSIIHMEGLMALLCWTTLPSSPLSQTYLVSPRITSGGCEQKYVE